jgi:hypothetical protein
MEHKSTLVRKKYLNASIIFFFACFIATQILNAQVCSNPNNIFGLSKSGNIYPIDITNASVGSVINTAAYPGKAPKQANALAYNTVNGLFYYFKINPGLKNQEFVSYNPTSNSYTTLATSPISDTVYSGCVNFNGSGYYCSDVMGSLYYYDISENQWTTITSSIIDQYGNNVSTIIQTEFSGDMAIDGLGNLWMLTSGFTQYGLYKISAPLPTSPQASVVASQLISPATSTPNGWDFEGIAFNALGDIFLTTGNNILYKLSQNLALSKIGKLNIAGVGNDLTSCNFPFTIMALNWTSFEVTSADDKVSISWSIAASESTKGFYVERSYDGKDWQSLAYVAFNEKMIDYSFSDESPASGNNYYRISEVNDDDNEEYSSVKFISIASSANILLWPNPAKNIINIQINEPDNNVHAQIFDLSGSTILTEVIHTGINIINIDKIPTGVYFVKISSNNGLIVNKKIIKM